MRRIIGGLLRDSDEHLGGIYLCYTSYVNVQHI